MQVVHCMLWYSQSEAEVWGWVCSQTKQLSFISSGKCKNLGKRSSPRSRLEQSQALGMTVACAEGSILGNWGRGMWTRGLTSLLRGKRVLFGTCGLRRAWGTSSLKHTLTSIRVHQSNGAALLPCGIAICINVVIDFSLECTRRFRLSRLVYIIKVDHGTNFAL
jgi:hypothetical protein